MRVDVFDRAKGAGRLGLARQLISPWRYIAGCLRGRNAVLYLALSGGRGQLLDLAYVLGGKMFRQRVFIHHHSFSYINSPSRLSRCLLGLVRNDTHVVLSRKMGALLARTYRLREDCVRVVSNAAFDVEEGGGGLTARDGMPISIGFLSNITLDKGFVEFFDILRVLERSGVRYQAYIAGPIAPEVRSTFERLLGAASGARYEGPVYGADKERFYKRLDIFLFPTKYPNEAEPLVVYEAMRHGVFVIACDRGAISEMLLNGAGLVFAQDDIVESAAMHITKLNHDRGALAHAREMALQQARRIRASGRTELEHLLDAMQCGSFKGNCADLL
jgi:glycosyltransferase involved in cell wall biosynthesis